MQNVSFDLDQWIQLDLSHILLVIIVLDLLCVIVLKYFFSK